jgi:hypothetical protein
MKAVNPNIDVRVYSSAGYFVPGIIEGTQPNLKVVTPNYDESKNDTLDLVVAAGLLNVYELYLSPTCVAGLTNLGIDVAHCASVSMTHKFLTLPTFFTQYTQDLSAISHPLVGALDQPRFGNMAVWPFDAIIEGEGVPRKPWDFNFYSGAADLKNKNTWSHTLEYLQKFGELTVKSLQQNSKDSDGYFVMGCLEHVGGLGVGGSGGPMSYTGRTREDKQTEALGCGKSSMDALADWFFRESPNPTLDRFVDPCLEKHDYLACNPTCVAFPELQEESTECQPVEAAKSTRMVLEPLTIALIGLLAITRRH